MSARRLEEEFPDTKYFRKEWVYGEQRAELVRGASNTAGRLPDRPGRAGPLCGLAANFYSLKTKEIPAGRMALGDWSRCYKVTTWWLFCLIWGGGAVWFRLGEPTATVAMGAWLILEFLSCVLDVGCPLCRALHSPKWMLIYPFWALDSDLCTPRPRRMPETELS